MGPHTKCNFSFIGGHFPVIKEATKKDGHMFNLYLKWTENYGLIWCRFLFWKAGIYIF